MSNLNFHIQSRQFPGWLSGPVQYTLISGNGNWNSQIVSHLWVVVTYDSPTASCFQQNELF